MKKLLTYCTVAALMLTMFSCMFVATAAAEENVQTDVVKTQSVAQSDVDVLTARTGPGVETYPTSTGVYNGYGYSVNLTTSEVTITEYEGLSTDLFFPEEIDSLPVVAIDAYALYGNEAIESIAIPGSIERIGQDAFGSCTALHTVTIENGVKYLENCAFEYCERLNTINIPDSVVSVGYDVLEGTAYINDVTNWDGDFLFVDRHLIATNEGISGTVALPLDTMTIASDAFYYQTAINEIILPDGLVGIGAYAFFGCTDLADIRFPDSVRVIGANCLMNTAYEEDNGNWDGNALYNGKHLLKVSYDQQGMLILRDGILTIGADAFVNAYNMTIVVIPQSLQYIGRYAFYDGMGMSAIAFRGNETQWRAIENVPKLNTISVYYNCVPSGDYWIATNQTDRTATVIGYEGDAEQLTIPATIGGYTVTAIGNHAFAENTDLVSVSFPDRVTTIGNHAFADCENISTLVLPASLETIGESAFNYLISLQTVDIPRGVTAIGDMAFYDCMALVNVTLPDTLRTIGNYAFAYNYKLESIVIPESVEEIGSNAFNCCEKLATITMPSGVCRVGSDAFCDTAFYYDEANWENEMLVLGSVLLYGRASGHVVIPPQVVSVAAFAMSYASEVTSLEFPDSVRYIGQEGFSGLSSLTSIRWPANLEYIGDHAFAYTYFLKQINLPAKVSFIGDYAFCCSMANTVRIPESVTFIGDYAFELTDIHDVYYGGTPSQWASLPIGAGNEYLIGALIHYGATDHETSPGIYEYNGDLYYADWLGRPISGYVYVTEAGTNGLIDPGYIDTDANGRLYHKEFVDFNGRLCYMEYGRPLTNVGVTEIDGSLYYIDYYGEVLCGEIWVMKTNGLTQTGWHYTDENGRFYDNQFMWTDGAWYYLEKGAVSSKRGVVTIGEDMYYIGWNGVVQSGKMWVTTTNDITQTGWHYTDELGRFYNNEFVTVDGKLYYMENGAPCDERGLTTIDGNLYYISWNGVIQTGRFWVSVTNGLGNVGYYTADENGVIG